MLKRALLAASLITTSARIALASLKTVKFSVVFSTYFCMKTEIFYEAYKKVPLITKSILFGRIKAAEWHIPEVFLKDKTKP